MYKAFPKKNKPRARHSVAPATTKTMTHFTAAQLRDMAKNQKDDLNGVEFLRALVEYLNNRPENLNAEKTSDELVLEFFRAIERRLEE